MGCLGLHLALTDETLKKFLAVDGDDQRAEYVANVLEEDWDANFAIGTEKAWDAIHRCLTGQAPEEEGLNPNAGAYPLNRVIVGGKSLTSADYLDYIIRLVDKREVPDIAKAIEPITEKWMTAAYHAHCKGAWPEYGPDDCGYTWVMFEPLKEFFLRAAEHGRHVVFAADQ